MKSTLYHRSMHLDTAQLLDASDRCPACGSTARRARVGVIQRKPMICLLRCSHCGICSGSQMPIGHVLDEYYSRYFTGDGPRITLPGVKRFVSNLLRETRLDLVNRDLRILDFGGGDGTLGLSIARHLLSGPCDRRIHFTLVDYQTPAPGYRDSRLIVAHRAKLEQVEGSFDLVVASAVLEHIPNLQPVLERLLGALEPQGWFYARTPYVVPMKRLLPNLDITYPGHLHDLGAPFWNRVPRTFNQPLRIIASRPSPVETDWLRQPVRSISAWLMKLPARLECAVLRGPRVPWWRLVGGWEILLQKTGSSGDSPPERRAPRGPEFQC